MTDRLRIALAQLNPVVGDIAGNLDKIRAARKIAAGKDADLVAFPELFVTGYPPEDLVVRRSFYRAAMEGVQALARETGDGGPGLLVGAPWFDEQRGLMNASILLDGGAIRGIRYKVHLPDYGVFDEPRVFEAGPMPGPVDFRGVRIGIPVCEDIWSTDVVECLEETGARILLVPNGSPFDLEKFETRIERAASRVRECGLPLAYINQFGGQDELVFDGGSFVLNPDSGLAVQMPFWEEALTLSDWVQGPQGWVCLPGECATPPTDPEAIYLAVTQGLRDYVRKNRFPGVVLGLSGGVDSALCAAIAVDALGAKNVHCVMLPYKYTSTESLEDAARCARALGVHYDTVPITAPVEGFSSALQEQLADSRSAIARENLQSRSRGVILMALSNISGNMVVTTGNKSEVSVGYATLYGDMNGGYNPIKDLYKMQVYALSAWRNTNHPRGGLGPKGIVIPENILTKPPSAELRENQTDQDSLPEYEVLDDILECLVERELPVADIVARGHKPEVVRRIEHLLYSAEYKRRQASPGVKISRRNYGRDRRYPITNGFRDTR